MKILRNRVYTEPANQWHKCLKSTKYSGNCAYTPFVHMWLIQTVCHGNRKSIHCQTNPKKNVRSKK